MFQGMQTHVGAGLVITPAWMAHTASKRQRPMFVVADCCCPLEINSVG